MKYVKIAIIFALGFIACFLWLSFDSKVRIETKNKLIIAREDLPEVFFDNYQMQARIGTADECK